MLPLVVTVTRLESTKPRTVAFLESPVFVGRGPLNELQLVEPWIARTEGVLEFGNDGISYMRQSARNPVTVDGREATLPGPHAVRSELQIGSLALRFERRPATPDELTPEPTSVGESPEVQRLETKAFRVDELRASWEERATSRPSSHGELAPDRPLPERAQAVVDRSRAGAAARLPTESADRPPTRGAEEDREQRRASPSTAPHSRVSESTAPVVPTRFIGVGTPSRPPSAPPPASWTPPPPAAGLSSSALPVPPSRPGGQGEGGELGALHESYRGAWAALRVALQNSVRAAPEDQRARLAHELQSTYPQIAQEPEFRVFLKSIGLRPKRPSDPDIEAWLARIEEAMPVGMKLQRGFTTDRLLQIVDALVSAFIDLNAAQEEVRRRSLGKLPRESILRKADDPDIVLAFLLNPLSDSSARLAELRDVFRSMVRHEWALMQATMEGARELLDALSPSDIAEREGVPLPDPETRKERGFWPLASADSPSTKLWFRFVEEFQSLVQGDRYQRTFLGARFSKRYTKAMGAGGTGSEGG